MTAATALCLALGHRWQLESKEYVNPNRHDLGARHTFYCVRCLTRRTVKR